jgi:transcriptional regulator with XRE-family HTH domain
MRDKENKSPLELIGERVQLKRKEMGLTQEQFAEKYGYPRTTLAKLEAGLRDFKSSELLALAEQLGVSCDYLLGRTRVEAPDDFIQEAVKRLGLSEAALRELSDMPSADGLPLASFERYLALRRCASTKNIRDVATLLLANEHGRDALSELARFYFADMEPGPMITQVVAATGHTEYHEYIDPTDYPAAATWGEREMRVAMLESAKDSLRKLREALLDPANARPSREAEIKLQQAAYDRLNPHKQGGNVNKTNEATKEQGGAANAKEN